MFPLHTIGSWNLLDGCKYLASAILRVVGLFQSASNAVARDLLLPAFRCGLCFVCMSFGLNAYSFPASDRSGALVTEEQGVHCKFFATRSIALVLDLARRPVTASIAMGKAKTDIKGGRVSNAGAHNSRCGSKPSYMK